MPTNFDAECGIASGVWKSFRPYEEICGFPLEIHAGCIIFVGHEDTTLFDMVKRIYTIGIYMRCDL